MRRVVTESTAADNGASSPDSAGPARVLVVEDDQDVLDLVSLTISFRWPSAKIYPVSTGAEALTLAEDVRLDLIILDIGLPDIDGNQVLKQVRQFSDVPVIMLTGRARESDIELFLNGGALADDYMIKPFSQSDLIERIEAVVARTAVEDGSRESDELLRQLDDSGELYEGKVWLNVSFRGDVRSMVSFVRQVNLVPALRLMWMANQSKSDSDIWLGLRQPMPLRNMIGDMDGVQDVMPGRTGNGRSGDTDPHLTVKLQDIPAPGD